MKIDRSSGVLLHPTCLPGAFPIGDLGPAARFFVDWIANAGFGCWQVLPLGPTGFGNSPYQCHSVLAGNPNLISPDIMLLDGLLSPADVSLPGSPESLALSPLQNRVDYSAVIPWKLGLVGDACHRFSKHARIQLQEEFAAFRAANSGWLQDYALFMALKQAYNGASLQDWPPEARGPHQAAQAGLARSLHDQIEVHEFGQWVFMRQWHQLRNYAHARGVRLIGDAPIFASLDSADVWAHPELFCLTSAGAPIAVAGVPPDYFAPTGQLWGNPLYDWLQHRKSGYAWWLLRLTSLLQLVDLVRLDHFRGFAGYWEIPASAATAENGRWMPGPGSNFLDALVQVVDRTPERPDLPLIAEDLGVVTPDVCDLLSRYELPGMRILQFAFSGLQDDFLPHNYPVNCVAYTGTHDNDTTRGWFEGASEQEKHAVLGYLGISPNAVVRAMIEAIWRSHAALTIVPVQDLLGLGSEARMNFPGRAEGWWEWRMPQGALTDSLALEFRQLNVACNRLGMVRAS